MDVAALAALAHPGDEGLIRSAILPGPEHGAQTAAVKSLQRILTLLAARLAEDVTTFEGKEALRAKLRERITQLLEDETVLDVLFIEFLVQ